MVYDSPMDWQLASATSLPSNSPSQRLYFFNEALPQAARNLRHVFAPVTKLGVVLDCANPWEQRGVASFCSTIVRLEDGRYRLYYTTICEHEMRIAVAESPDGLRWERLKLGQEHRDGKDTNLIVLSGVPGSDPSLGIGRQDQVGQPQVLRTPDGHWRMYYWHHQHGWARLPYVYTVAESADGLSWHVPDYKHPALNSHWLGDQSALDPATRLAEKARRTNDANYVYYNPTLGCYEQFSQYFLDAIPERRVTEDNCPNFHRMIQRRISADGLTWSAPELVIQADDRDPWDQQFYHLAVQYHEDWLIGSLGHYRVENAQQTQDLELVFSRDGRRWERPLRGGFIPRETGGRDAEGIYPPNAWIDCGDHWLCLYSGTARKHNCHNDDTMPGSCIMAASWSKHRFVGVQADRVPGGFLTPVFFMQSEEIKIDAVVRGWLRAELCDAWGRKLDGYHLEDCLPIQGDDTAHILRWREKSTTDLRHDPLRLRLEFTDTEVYNVQF